MYFRLRINPLLTYSKAIYFPYKRYEFAAGRHLRYVSQNHKTDKEIVRDDGTEYRSRGNKKGLTSFYYLLGVTIFMIGMGFSALPLYEKFCKVTNYGGILSGKVDVNRTKNLKRVPEKQLTIIFNADTNATLQWNFKPLQPDVKVVPGETVLAFYTAENPTDKRISGISTYNVTPFEAAQYFNKIQCFCFDEQQLNAHEQVDMPVFFFIDPEFVKDPYMHGVDTITLSYTFFEAKEGLSLPFMPQY